MNQHYTIFNLPERELNPPEGYEWTKREMEEAAERVVDDILFNNEQWDENVTGYKGDMFLTWENIMLQFVQGSVDGDEALALMHDALLDNVKLHAREMVESDPDTYCEVVFIEQVKQQKYCVITATLLGIIQTTRSRERINEN